MSYVSPASSVNATNFVMHAVSDFFGNRKARRARLQAVHALNNLDPMALKDIALSRPEIQAVVFNVPSGSKRRWH
ncbi:MAG: DUF1127 domain-containing protein [Rhizobiaceae bacterium]|nr:DUF1127 domain-containing protein [Rhizobiaceae bacterium]